MKPKILLTGGLGYLGGRLARDLMNSERYSLRIASKRICLNEIPKWLQKQEIVTMDMLSEPQMIEACSGIDHIVHLAALNEIECAKQPDLAMMINAIGTLRLAEAARNCGVKRFVYLSTAHIYGAPLVGKISEQSIPRAKHPYAISKLAGEHFLLSQGNLEALVVRVSNGFGCPVHSNINRWTLAVNDFCRQAVTTDKIVLRSSGKDYRDFIPFSDITRAIQHLLGLPAEKIQDGIFNLGSGRSVQVRTMAELVSKRSKILFGSEVSICVPQQNEEKINENLEYNMTKITNTGFVSGDSLEQEIDCLLKFCKREFAHG